MKVYIVIDRNDGEIDGVYYNEDDAASHCRRFELAEHYDMEYEEHHVRQHFNA